MREFIVSEDSFEEDIQELSKKYPRMDDVRAAIRWTLMHNPFRGTAIDNHDGFFVHMTTQMGDTPMFRVLYEYKGQWPVMLLSIGLSANEEDEF
jgi:hypothetical protein